MAGILHPVGWVKGLDPPVVNEEAQARSKLTPVNARHFFCSVFGKCLGFFEGKSIAVGYEYDRSRLAHIVQKIVLVTGE